MGHCFFYVRVGRASAAFEYRDWISSGVEIVSKSNQVCG